MNLAAYIDHTLLKPEASESNIIVLCQEAIEFGFYSVCVNPFYVPKAREIVNDSTVKVCTVVGFPLGCVPVKVKIQESKWCIEHGAREIDMVVNIGAVKSQRWPVVKEEIKTLAEECHSHASILKVIFETALLSNEEIMKLCEVATHAQADFVKTSTGFSTRGASEEDVRLMKKCISAKMGVKASGGIRDRVMALKMIEAGATRIGTSAGIKICQS